MRQQRILDEKGFLVPRDEPPDRVVEVKLRCPLDELRMLATLVDSFYDGNPIVDNCEIAYPARDLSEAKDAIVRQLRDQGVKVLPRLDEGETLVLNPVLVASAFVRRLRDQVGDNWARMCRENREDPDCREGKVCHSHDFTDANQVMIDAMAEVAGRELSMAEVRGSTDLHNAAWTIAHPALRGE